MSRQTEKITALYERLSRDDEAIGDSNSIGKYSNKYVKMDGKWLFAELTGVIDQTAPWDKGWVKAAITKESW